MTADSIKLRGHALVFSVRGFVQSLTDAQRAVFLELFEEGEDAKEVLSAALEQAKFERGYCPIEHPAPALMAALEYALPRSSAAPSIVADEIEKHWDSLSEATRKAIRDRIQLAVDEGRSGMDFDTREWLEIARKPLNEAERAERMQF